MFLRAAVLFVLACTVALAQETPVYPLQRVVIADSAERAQALQPDASTTQTLFVQGLPLLEAADFKKIIDGFIGKPIGAELLNSIAGAIGTYARENDRLITSVNVPDQNVADGTLRLVVTFGRFTDIAIRGNKYFSSELLEQRLGIKPGDEIRLSVLEDAVNWTNTNPFRHVKVVVNPIQDQPGRASLLVGVKEVAPWRASLSIDNSGNEILGKLRYVAAVQAGNIWGRDHIGSYQFITTGDPDKYQAHVATYRVPLPWRHVLEASAAYSAINLDLLTGVYISSGSSRLADIKYTIPIRRGTQNPIEVFAGINFKRSNNNLEFAGMSVYDTYVDTIQLALGGSVVKRDKYGATAIVATLSLSPGDITRRNTIETFQEARKDANPRYAYGDLSVQRVITLPKDWELAARMTARLASTNLVGSEQITTGGVRGYKTNLYAGDEGFTFSGELSTPAILTPLKMLKPTLKPLPPLQTRFVGFYDAGQVWLNQGPNRMRPVASAGLGLRTSFANNFSVTFDYGWRLTSVPAEYRNTASGRGHLKVALAF